ADEVADVALGVVGRGDRQAHGRLAAAGDVAAVDGLEDGGVVGRDVVGGDVPAAVRPGQLEAVAVVPDGGLDGEGPVGLAAGEGVVLGLVAVGRVVDEDGLDGLEVRDAGGLPVDLVERTPAGAVVDVDAVAGGPLAVDRDDEPARGERQVLTADGAPKRAPGVLLDALVGQARRARRA